MKVIPSDTSFYQAESSVQIQARGWATVWWTGQVNRERETKRGKHHFHQCNKNKNIPWRRIDLTEWWKSDLKFSHCLYTYFSRFLREKDTTSVIRCTLCATKQRELSTTVPKCSTVPPTGLVMNFSGLITLYGIELYGIKKGLEKIENAWDTK